MSTREKEQNKNNNMCINKDNKLSDDAVSRLNKKSNLIEIRCKQSEPTGLTGILD